MKSDFKVEMRPAYQWVCHECGHEQFESCMIAEFSKEDREGMAREMGMMEEWSTELPEYFVGEFVTHPNAVTCSKCGEQFETEHYSEG